MTQAEKQAAALEDLEATLRGEIDSLTTRLVGAEAQIGVLLQMVSAGVMGKTATTQEPLPVHDLDDHAPSKAKAKLMAFLRRLSPKQHVALQMLLQGASNKEIAERCGTSENTAKVHVRALCTKADPAVRGRHELTEQVDAAWELIDPTAYKAITGGLPKNWAETYTAPDTKYSHLYTVVKSKQPKVTPRAKR